tara:strand:+ start:3836 stop:5113 length:1278 start_codon:yes stop_codon:yes gene_type:complete
MKNKIAVGLDIGTTKISVIVGVRNDFGKIEILGIGKTKSTGVMRGIVANIDQTTNAIMEAKTQAENQSSQSQGKEIKISNVNIGIAGQHIRSLQNRGQMVREDVKDPISDSDLKKLKDDVYKLVMTPGEEIIHVIPQEYIVDSQIEVVEPKGITGTKLEANFHVITGQVAAIQNIKTCVNNSNLKVQNLTLEPLASAEAVLDKEEIDAGVVLVDIGGGTTDVAIYKDNVIRHTAVIPFGGNVITGDIRDGCSILDRQAEQLKKQYGSALAELCKENESVVVRGLRNQEAKHISFKILAGIIECRMKEIFSLVKHEINNSGYGGRLIGGIVLTGGGSQLKNIQHLAKLEFGTAVRIGYPDEHLSKDSKVKVNNPIYSTAIGLVMKAFDDYQNVIDEENTEREKSPLSDFFKKFTDKIESLLKDDTN